MEPTLGDGDQVMYDETRRAIVDGKMYVVRIGNESMVKRLYTRPGRVLVKSDNPMHEPFEAALASPWPDAYSRREYCVNCF